MEDNVAHGENPFCCGKYTRDVAVARWAHRWAFCQAPSAQFCTTTEPRPKRASPNLVNSHPRMFRFRIASRQHDIELGQPSAPKISGFPSVATFIVRDPDHSFSIYPAFHKLSSRNLLYLEAELWELQREQDIMDIQDARTGDPDFFRSWKKLSTSREPRQLQRMDLIVRIRAKLKEYRRCPRLNKRCRTREC